jgi:hypothetical protein
MVKTHHRSKPDDKISTPCSRRSLTYTTWKEWWVCDDGNTKRPQPTTPKYYILTQNIIYNIYLKQPFQSKYLFITRGTTHIIIVNVVTNCKNCSSDIFWKKLSNQWLNFLFCTIDISLLELCQEIRIETTSKSIRGLGKRPDVTHCAYFMWWTVW